MNIDQAVVLDQVQIAEDVFKLDLKSSLLDKLLPGKFINVKIRNFSLRRPISICSIEEDFFTVIYKAVGDGTRELSTYKKGDKLEILGPLGRFFSIHEDLDRVLLIGGGLGVPPLYEVAKRYRALGKEVVAVLGFRSRMDVFLEAEFKALGVETFVATDDGSYGFKGNVLSLISEKNIDIDFVYTVGPKPMLRAVQEKYQKGYLSLEERMACGVGLCMGCVCKDKANKDKHYRICKEGPVFELGKVEI